MSVNNLGNVIHVFINLLQFVKCWTEQSTNITLTVDSKCWMVHGSMIIVCLYLNHYTDSLWSIGSIWKCCWSHVWACSGLSIIAFLFSVLWKKIQASSVPVPNLWNSFTLHIRLSTFAISIQSPLWPFQFLFHSLCHFPQCIFCFTFKIFFTLLRLLVVHYLLNDDDNDVMMMMMCSTLVNNCCVEFCYINTFIDLTTTKYVVLVMDRNTI